MIPEILPPFVKDHDLWMALKGWHFGTKATALFLNYRFFEGRAGSTQSSSNWVRELDSSRAVPVEKKEFQRPGMITLIRSWRNRLAAWQCYPSTWFAQWSASQVPLCSSVHLASPGRLPLSPWKAARKVGQAADVAEVLTRNGTPVAGYI